MKVSRFQITEKGVEVASKVAQACGGTFIANAAGAVDGDFLTWVFCDVQRATAPQFDHVNMVEFTRRRLSAWADITAHERPYIHVDQYLDQWLLAATHLLGLRAFYNLQDDIAKSLNSLLARTLNMAVDPEVQKSLRDDMIDVFVDFPEALKVTHQMSMGSLVFIVCHELAHHAAGDRGQDAGHKIEFAADQRGLELMVEVYRSAETFQVLRPSALGFAGVWSLFILWDLIERGMALSQKRGSRMPRETHPFALARLEELMPQLESFEDVRRFREGFFPAVEKIRRDLGVAGIT